MSLLLFYQVLGLTIGVVNNDVAKQEIQGGERRGDRVRTSQKRRKLQIFNFMQNVQLYDCENQGTRS